jgi:hypothetical protein
MSAQCLAEPGEHRFQVRERSPAVDGGDQLPVPRDARIVGDLEPFGEPLLQPVVVGLAENLGAARGERGDKAASVGVGVRSSA